MTQVPIVAFGDHWRFYFPGDTLPQWILVNGGSVLLHGSSVSTMTMVPLIAISGAIRQPISGWKLCWIYCKTRTLNQQISVE